MSTTDAIFPPGATHRDWIADGFVAVSLTLVSVIAFIGLMPYDETYAAAVVLSVSMTSPLVLRRHAPLAMLALCTLAGIGQLVFLPFPTASLLAVPIVSYSVARWVPGMSARSVIVIGTFASVLGPLRWFGPYSNNPSTDLFVWGACLGAVLTPYAIGRRTKDVMDARQHQIQTAEERYQFLLAEREQQTRLAEASTRALIARELHDIVAHSLSVMIVQAEGGRAAATRKPEVAVEALDTIAETGREALQEMRRIVGVLRGNEAQSPTYAPAPSMREITDLVARIGERASLATVGNPYPVSSALELTVYRVAQEALTNFLKHAGPDARAHVTLTYAFGHIEIDITDDGAGPAAPSPGGNGLLGMHERVTSMGGTLRAGPLPNGVGFRVTAVLPVREHPTPKRTP